MKAEKPPSARQSRPLEGWKKLAAKMMKTAELTTTNTHNP